MRVKYRLLCAALLTGALIGSLRVATAQTIPCTAVAPEVRDRVRADGACSDSAGERQRASQSKAVPRAAAPGAAAAGRRSALPKSSARDARPEALPVPGVVGTTIENAQSQLQGFEVERVDRPGQAPAGEVIEQTPDASASVAAGSRVSLVVSSGPPTVQLPNVVDRSYDEATAALSTFSVVRVQVPGAAPSGQVLTQEPPAGSAVLPGSSVVLRVSDGSLASAAAVTPTVAATPTRAAARPPDDRIAFLLQTNTMLAIVVSLLLGTTLGALSMRRWLLRPQPATDSVAILAEDPVVTAGEPLVGEPAPAPVTFFARLDAGEIAVQFPLLIDDSEPEKEYASDR